MSVSCSESFSDFLCCEDSGIVLSSSGPGGGDMPECSSDVDSVPPDVDESVAGLVDDERNYFPGVDYMERFRSHSLNASDREFSIAWILKVQRFCGFQPLTAYLAVNYFDRFLYSRRLPQSNGWPLQLLSVACLSVAAKMEELLVPSLLDLQVEGPKYIFEPRTILRMELLVLNVLDWKLRLVTPFDFLSFFSSKIDSTGIYNGFLISRASQIILSNIKEARFLEYKPSCIGAASMICAANELPNFSLVSTDHAEKWCHGLRKENIVKCRMLMMQRSSTVNRQTRAPKVLPQLRVMTRTSIPFTESPSPPSSTSSNASSPFCKRRKLNCTFE